MFVKKCNGNVMRMRLRDFIFKGIVVCVFGAVCSPTWAFCYAAAGSKYKIDPTLLKAIALTESSFRANVESPTQDIGLMGINRSWLPILNKRFGMTERDVWQPCTNVHLGAWIIANNYRQFGKNWTAIGAYAASCRKHKGFDCQKVRIAYARKVYSNWLKIKNQPL